MRPSEPQAPTHKDAASAPMRRIYLLSGGALILLSGLAVYAFYMGTRMERVDSPLIDAIHQMQMEASHTEVWIDNILMNSHQTDEGMDAGWKDLDQAIAYFQHTLTAKKQIGDSILTEPISSMDEQVAFLEAKLARFKSSTQTLLSNLARGGKTALPAQNNREDYRELLVHLYAMEETLRAIAHKNQHRFFIAQSGVLGIVVVLGLLFAVAVKRVENQRADHLRILGRTNQRLQEEIQERKKTQEALKTSEALFRDVFRTSPESINISRITDGLILEVNEGFTALTGYSPAEAVGKTVEELRLWRDPANRKNFIDELNRNGFVRNLATQFVTSGGAVRSVLLSSKIITTQDEPHILTVTRDITEIKETEARLRKSEETFRSFFESAADMIHLLDPEGRILMTNPMALERLKYGAREMFGRKLSEFMAGPSAQAFRENFPSLLRQGCHRAEYEFMARDGSIISVDASASTIRDENDHPSYVISFHKDITERKLAERKLSASHQFLSIANRHTGMIDVLKDFISEMRRITDCRSVAVRILNDAGGLPYAAACGFDREFCSLDPTGASRKPGICRMILERPPRPGQPFFSPYGSFHHNHCTRFWGSAPEYEKDPLHNPCCHSGFESLALIPIRSGNANIGLIHLADRRKNRVPFDVVEILESAAMQLGSAIQRIRAEEALKASHEILEKKVLERTEALLLTNAKLKQEIEEHLKTEQALLHYQAKLRNLSAEMLKTGERERRRIASEIHDRIGQTLAIAKIQLGALRAATFDAATLKAVDAVRDLITQTIQDTRSLTFELSPPVLYELGLVAALESLAETLRKQSGIRIRVQPNTGDDSRLDSNTRELLFRTLRELMLNVVKHARASQATVSLRLFQDHLQATVSDDGVGFSPDDNHAGEHGSQGFGLFSIQEQLNHHGGRATIASAPGGGTRVTIDLPLPLVGSSET